MIVDLANNDVGIAVKKEERSLINDLSFGLSNQPIVIKKLIKYFDEDIIETTDKFSQYDAYSTTTLYEIKCRRCLYNQYDTTIIPIHKTFNIHQRLVFVFKFINGLYYIEYNKNLFDGFDTKDVIVYRKGSLPKNVLHYLIPIEMLIKIDI
jgi:hypothetical protein